MAAQIYNSTYLSGWEYNLLLQDDPLKPRNSALPAELLWNGGAQLWMFETVYCTKESLEAEKRAAEVLKWSSGKIFSELEEKGFIKSVDWNDLSESTKTLLAQSHAKLRSEISEDEIRSLIREEKSGDLETIKVQLLDPVMRELHCIKSVSPNSLKTWKRPTAGNPTEYDRVEKFLADLAAPIDPDQQRTGIRLCNPPGTGVSASARAKQNIVQFEIERPMIPTLVAGDEPYAGEQGHRRYMEPLRDHIADYAPINSQLYSDWSQNIDNLTLPISEFGVCSCGFLVYPP